MDGLLTTIVENAPNMIGLGILATVLYRQNERLLSQLFDEVAELKSEVEAMKQRFEDNV